MTQKLETIFAFDPGKVTGMSSGVFGDDTPLTMLGGVALTYEEFMFDADVLSDIPTDAHVVSEVFTLRTNNDFAADLHGVRVEGVLEHYLGSQVVWRNRTYKELVTDGLLKRYGFWRTGRDVHWEDGRDVNDATIHMLGYVAFSLKHRPTLDAYFRG